MADSGTNINWIDAKILKALLKNGRENFATIAKRVGVTKNVVWKHYKKMRRIGIIKGFTAQMDYPSLGFAFVVDIQITVKPRNLEPIIEFLQQLPSTYGVWRTARKSQIAFVSLMRNSFELDSLKNAIKTRWAVSNMTINIWTRFIEKLENLSLGPFQEDASEDNEVADSTISDIQKSPCKIGKIELEIIDRLNRNGDLSFRKIAKEMGISTNMVSRRYNKLSNNGILKVSVQIDPTKMGYKAVAYFNVIVTTMAQDHPNIEDVVMKIPDVFAIAKISGDYDFKVFALIKDINELLEIQATIGQIPGVMKLDLDVGSIGKDWPACTEKSIAGIAWPCMGHQKTTPIALYNKHNSLVTP